MVEGLPSNTQGPGFNLSTAKNQTKQTNKTKQKTCRPLVAHVSNPSYSGCKD
jgi:hypothetical protein